jgi:hypothetical protein
MKKLIFLIIAALVMLNCTMAWAECADVSGATSWSRIDTHKIIIYRGSTPLALLDIPYCYIYSTSEIRFIKDYVCNWDKIIIDGEVCDIRNVERL